MCRPGSPRTGQTWRECMTAQELIEAFHLPTQALVEQRIAKKMLVEQGAPTPADKRLITNTVEELVWHAALKPGTVGLPAADGVIELALLFASLRPSATAAQAQRVRQLIHRAIPYPVLLVCECAGTALLSVADKRASQAEVGQWVTDSATETHALGPGESTGVQAAFVASLALDQMPRPALVHLAALYQAYAHRITALEAAGITGRYTVAPDPAGASAQRAALAERQRTLQQLAAARAAAGKEKQIARRVELNLRIQSLQHQLKHAESRLTA